MPNLEPLSATAARLASTLRFERLQEPRIRRWILLAAVAGFVAGIVLSLRAQPDVLQNVQIAPVIFMLLVMIPATVLLNALEFRLAGELVGARIPFPTALETTIVGSAANMLPLPGSTVVRFAALKAAGTGLRASAASTFFVALIWLGIAFGYSGLWVLALGGTLMGTLFVGVGLVVLAGASLVMPMRSIPRRLLTGLVATKLVLVALDGLRIFLCLIAIGSAATVGQASALAVSGAVGSAVSIVPAGLGVREAVAAGMGSIVALAASSAFLATSLNRLLGLVAVLPVTIVLGFRSGKPTP